jgi:hypothetical protein
MCEDAVAAALHFNGGHNFKLTKHFARTDVRKNFFSNRVVNYWNDLPSAVVSAPTLDSFKRRLQIYF